MSSTLPRHRERAHPGIEVTAEQRRAGRRGAMRTAILGAALVVVGLVAVAVGILPVPVALVIADRVWPILLFVIVITVVTELAAAAGLFRAFGPSPPQRDRRPVFRWPVPHWSVFRWPVSRWCVSLWCGRYWWSSSAAWSLSSVDR